MGYIVTAAEMKRCDHYMIHEIGIPSMVLMERAALAVTDELFRTPDFSLRKVLCVCGAGNNGGDGVAVARLLHLKGIPVAILFVGQESHGTEETARQLRIARHYEIPVHQDLHILADPSLTVLVDALFGIGLSRPPEGVYADVIHHCNQSPARILSVDIPSGISADTGEIMGVGIQAAKTVVLAYQKAGLTKEPGKGCAGQIVIRDIGITDIGFAGRLPSLQTAD